MVHYKLIIKIYGGEKDDKLLYFNSFEEQVFNQVVQVIKNGSLANPSGSQHHPMTNTDFLELSQLSICEKNVKVVIEYGCSFSSIPKTAYHKGPLDSIIECYGYSLDPQDTPGILKTLLDKKAQEYWMGKCKLYSLGKSLPMLSVQTPQGESLVPQGTQSSPSLSASKEKEEAATAEVEISSLSTQVKEHHTLMSELELLQEELKGKIKAQDPNIKEIVEKIQQVQSSMEKYEDVVAEVQSTAVIPSLEYYLTIVSDITKLIRNLVKQNKQIPIERVSQIMRECEKSGDLS